ncbi:hypothetical protein OEZ85_012540 [Tetradesmus obliquus]|uniref:Bidirectional sugar transporter SWEET n=1 Tax=Tetradesmus obliquus TaxID=3088 RepID=A0ABY8TU23_TETOB|nr:hypothetical protein OEZ85_012540 [Tetradesmus obliquus]
MGSQVFLGTVVPILGGIIGLIMYCSPLSAARAARQAQSLGELNPVPFAVTFMSTACWNAYGLAAPDYNMFLPNIPGFVAALYTSVTCYGLASSKASS